MANNEYYNKLVVGGVTKFDLTADTITKDKVLTGFTFHDKSGKPDTGTCDFDTNTQDADVAVAEILVGKKAYARGVGLIGTMTNNSATTLEIDDVNDELAIPQGYHDGSGKAKLKAVEKAKIIAGNIKSGVEILGVTGAYTGEAITAQSKNITPSFSQQTVLPDSGYDYLSQVTVGAIPVTETDNSAGGKTITIG